MTIEKYSYENNPIKKSHFSYVGIWHAIRLAYKNKDRFSCSHVNNLHAVQQENLWYTMIFFYTRASTSTWPDSYVERKHLTLNSADIALHLLLWSVVPTE